MRWNTLFARKQKIRLVHETVFDRLDAIERFRDPRTRAERLQRSTGISRKTVDAILSRRDGTHRKAEVEALARALDCPAFLLMEPEKNESRQVEALRQLRDASVGQVLDFGRQAFQLWGGLWSLVHWAGRVSDSDRRHRQHFAQREALAGWGIVEISYDGVEDFEAVVSYRKLVGPVEIIVDFGSAARKGGRVSATSLLSYDTRWGAEDVPGRLTFAVWLDANVDDFMVRSARPFSLVMTEGTGIDDTERRIFDEADPLVGFTRWVFHRYPPKRLPARTVESDSA